MQYIALKACKKEKDCCLADGIDSIPCHASYFPPGWSEEEMNWILNGYLAE